MYIYTHIIFVKCLALFSYEVAMISRLPKNIGLFCKRALLKRRYSAKETYNLKEPTNRSHPISWIMLPMRTKAVLVRIPNRRHTQCVAVQNIVSFIGLFCKETYNFEEPANCSHPICSGPDSKHKTHTGSDLCFRNRGDFVVYFSTPA